MAEEEIIIPENRKSKNDKKAKGKYNVYKKGGHNRINKPKGL